VAEDALVAGVLGGTVATGLGRPPPDVQDTVTRTAAITAGAARIWSVCRAQRSKSCTVIVSSRPGPTPIAEIGAPIISSSAAT
jgi:hypothetical protein